MEASLQLAPGVALQTLGPLLRQHGAHAHAMHPGVRDAALACWYTLTAADAASLAAAVTALQSAPGVAAAYLKTDGEPPG